MTVNGEIPASEMGQALIHEHVLVDFIGADSTGYHRWNREEVVEKVLPYLLEVKELGCKTLLEYTPMFLGRDPLLLKMLAEESGLTILTNTGYYGALDNRFLPENVYTETSREIANKWISEWENGIEGTGIKPGFIKIGVAPDSLSELHSKLVRAAGLTHLETGLTIAAHTGPAVPAFQEIGILKDMGVSPNAFVWVHAQMEEDHQMHIRAAREGAWISLDGLSAENVDEYVTMIGNLNSSGLLNRVLISHDAGWYTPGEKDGGDFRPYTPVFEALIPALKASGYSDQEIDQIFIENPAEAFTIKIRKLE